MYRYQYNVFGILSAAAQDITDNVIELDKKLVNKKGYVWVYRNEEVYSLADNRGIYYDISNGQQIIYEKLGELEPNLTPLVPNTPYDKWDGKKWITDQALKRDALKNEALAQRDSLLTIASEKIAPLQDAVDLNMATDEEAANLKDWKKYRVQLNRIEQQVGFPDNVEWPVMPS